MRTRHRRQGEDLSSVRLLGISAYYHDSAAAVVVDGQIVSAAQEERFTRRKNDPGFPDNAIRAVMEIADLAPEDLTAVVFYDSPYAKFERLLATQSTGRPQGALHFARSVSSMFPSKMRVAGDVRRVLGPGMVLHYSDHHLSHAASAYLPSPFQEAAIITVDGVGEWTTTSIAYGNLDSIQLLEQVEYPNSLGLFYSALTAYCGFRVNSGEYKLMGLAPYANPASAELVAQKLLENVIYLAEDGSFALNPRFFHYTHSPRAFGGELEELLGGRARKEQDALEQRHADIAAAGQIILNQAMLSLARRAYDLTGSANLCMAGGVALNVTANSYLAQRSPFDRLWVQPAAGDAGGALGAALWATYDIYGRGVQADGRPGGRKTSEPGLGGGDDMRGALLGPTPGEDVAEVLERLGLVYEQVTEAQGARLVAQTIADGGIVGVARGRMEYGPRALGNRSVLADPRIPGMQRRLNLTTKMREGFRPFAPAVAAEDASTWFADCAESPYMLRTFNVKHASSKSSEDESDWSTRLASVDGPIPAVTHVDCSARVQTVDRDVNPGFHAIIKEFKNLTGCPVVINTSFNVRGEPIVLTALDAAHAFLRMNLDGLLLGDFWLRRSGQPEGVLRTELPAVEGVD